jgi:cobalt-zinc-cadmium efflux system protein
MADGLAREEGDGVDPHSHDGHDADAPRRRLLGVLLLTAGFMVVEAVGGWLAGSLALLADAGHMLTDVGALGLSLLTARIGARPADDRKTDGYRRWEILAALVNAVALFAIVAWVVVEALHRLRAPRPVEGGLMVLIALGGLLVNAVALRLLHAHHAHNLNTRGAYLHILGDFLGSIAAVVAGVVILFTGWTPADPILSIAVALLIVIGAWRLLRESLDVLLEAVPPGISMRDVEARMRAVPGVSDVHDLHVWTVRSGLLAMSGHAVVPDLGAHPDVLTNIRDHMAALGIGHVTVQLEVEEGCEGGDCG